jgi:16S rRNA processing protein RimM
VGAWGVKGAIKVVPYAADPKALFSSRRWFIKAPATARPAVGVQAALPELLKITGARSHGDGVVATAQDIEDRTAAEALKGALVFVARSSFPTAGNDEYYWVDLIGLMVVNREGQALGTVTDLLDTGPHSVLRIAVPGPRAGEDVERMIPFVSAYIDHVDLQARRITVDWGLDY